MPPAAGLAVLARSGRRSGSAADIFVFSLEEGEFPLEDTHLKVIVANRMIRPHLTFKAGQAIEPGSYPGCLRNLQTCDFDVFQRTEETA